MMESTTAITDLVDEISTTCEQQSNSIEQITVGIGQISDVVMHNSAAAEESVAISESLSDQATVLKNMISRFKLHDVQQQVKGRQKTRTGRWQEN